MKIVLILALALLTHAGPSWAIKWQTIEEDCIYQLFQATATDTDLLSGAFTTHSVTGLLLSWSVESLGTGTGTFDIAHSTSNDSAPNLLVSSATTVNAGKSVSEDVRGILRNPRIRMRSLTASTTVYVRMSYCRKPENP